GRLGDGARLRCEAGEAIRTDGKDGGNARNGDGGLMPKARTRTLKQVEALKHEEASRKNIPTAEYQSLIEKEDLSPVQIAYQRRNRDLDPQLVWRGKDEQDWSDLVVSAPPLYIQEKLHPKVLIDDLLRRSRGGEAQ